MTGNLHVLAARYAGRPQLILPRAAADLVSRLGMIDARAEQIAARGRPALLQRVARLFSTTRAPVTAMDDDSAPAPPLEQRLAYAPLYIGEPEAAGFCWTLSQGVALMQADTVLLDRGEDFCGVCYHGYDTLLAGLREALADARVKAVFLRLASPGGLVSGGLPALAAFMREARAAGGGKPIWVYADMACSAAYWIAAQADRILAPAQGLIGSIGAVLVHEDWSGALEKAGVRVTAIQFGSQKTAGAWWDGLTPEAQADLQAEIDQCGRDFIADLVAGRSSVSSEAAIATQARVFMGRHDEAERSALALKLVDAIASEEEAFAELVSTVSASVSAPKPGNPQGPAAKGSRGGPKTSKEEPMAGNGSTQPAAKAALTAEKTRLEARLTEIRAEEQAHAAAAPDPDMADEADEAEDAADGGADEAAEGEAGEGEETDTKKSPEAVAIAASAEAKAHPTLALAAIQTGQTLAQFRASVEAAGPAARPSPLREAMAGAPRAGPDAPRADTGGAKIDPKAIYDRRRGGARGRR